MATYFMNADVNEHTIIPDHSSPSEYQDLIDAYLAGGGKITKCREGARTTTTSIPSYTVSSSELDESQRNKGRGLLFDEIELGRGRQYKHETDLSTHFDKPEKF